MRQVLVFSAILALTPAMGALAQQANDAAPAQQQQQQQAVAEPPLGTRALNLCRACHTINEGGRTLIGPNPYGVFGRRTASVEGTVTPPP